MRFKPGQIFECQTEDVQEGQEARLQLLDISVTGQVTLDDGQDLTSQIKIPVERLTALVDGGYWELIVG